MNNQRSEHTAFIRFKHTKLGRLVWALITAAIAYAVLSLAIDSGALWQWAVAFLFAADSVYNLVQLVRKFINHDNNYSDKA